jgi:acetyl-CoA synthetase
MKEKSKAQTILEPSPEFLVKARIKKDEYRKLCNLAEQSLEEFWREFLNELDWFKKPTRILDETNAPFYKWFEDGTLNASYNCLDRHLDTGATKPALIWEGEDGQKRKFTYKELYLEVNKSANALKRLGVRKGDRVCLYLPMIPELPIAMLACARIGAIHSVVFGGFSAESLRYRIKEAGAKILITVDGYWRAGKTIDAFTTASKALKGCSTIEHVIVVERLGGKVQLPQKDPPHHFWNELIRGEKEYCPPEEMNAEDTLFLLYTSGSTGSPKGVIHTTGGYLLYTHLSFKWIFDHKETDIYWCTADIGWITGHSYIVYGPLSNGATVFMYEGVPTYPHPGKWWELIDKYRITILYTAPTAIRALMGLGDEWPARYSLDSLRLLGTVGEPINPTAWLWYYENIGKGRCPVVDTWWQTETGGILITTLPGVHSMKPGSAGFPFPGIFPDVIKHREEDLDDDTPDLKRPRCPTGVMGKLVIRKPWPGMLRTLWKNPERFKKTYFQKFGAYLTGDGALKDEDGYYWLKGRIDDIILVSGHNIGTAEVESALVSHPAVAEAALTSYPHPVTLNALYAFVTVKAGVKPSEELRKGLIVRVRNKLGPTYKINKLQFAEGLPKTRSGKIMRRILKKIAGDGASDLGDTSTLLDPSIIKKLIEERIEG